MKKALCILLSAVMIFAAVFFADAAAFKYGDVTGDSKVNSSDALLVLMVKVGLKSFDSTQKKAADVDGNGQLNSNDALLILSYSINLIKKFPVEEQTEKITEKPTEKTTETTTSATGGDADHNNPQLDHDTF